MKIKTKEMPYAEVMALPRPKHIVPHKPDIFFRALVRLAAIGDLKDAGVSYEMENGCEELLKKPCLILMNHSSFIDLEIVSKIMFPKPYCIVCTSDGFVGKPWLMRMLGCIPTQKFVTDIGLIKDIAFALKKRKTSVLMYPEASYSFDGTATELPRGLGRFVKMLGVPVIMIRTYGAFARDPLYNCLQKRKVKVSAGVRCLVKADETANMSAADIQKELDKAFSFDNFAWQHEQQLKICEPFRADGLERMLYKCAECGAEGTMKGEGTVLSCSCCGKKYKMTEYGRLEAEDGKTRFPHIPDWYRWERECVWQDLENGSYELETDVEVCVMVDYKCIYKVGEGTLRHDKDGFRLNACDGQIDYVKRPQSCYSLYSDFYWYEIGDMICIGDRDCLYYCFPKKQGVVAKTRMATEELYKLTRGEVRKEE